MDALASQLKQWGNQGLGTPLLLVIMLCMMMLPVPPFALDILFTFNIAFGLSVLLAVVYCERPLDFAVFPTVILLSTLLRLALNIASTRVVLLYGHTGTGAAGDVIKAFGEVVIGGNYAVGLVIFSILVVINFVVVTKGAGRVSEVSARFTLDSLPGKQMAIDADLNAGIITQEESVIRREEVAQESDFYGSMDGASKFVRGDAVAGIFILAINIVGGFVIGMSQHDMTFAGAAHNYVLLTIGDGLVAQIPSIILSTAAAIMVTRNSKSGDMGGAVLSQVFGNKRSLMIAGGIIGGLGIIPGMPHVPFIIIALGLFAGAYYQKIKDVQVKKEEKAKEKAVEQDPNAKQAPLNEELSWDDVQGVDVVALEVGYRLIPLVDSSQGGALLSRVKGVRKKLSQELGFLLSSVHIRDNLDLTPMSYRISLAGVTMGQAEVQPDKLMAINPGQVFGQLNGLKTVDPAFGLEAYWISEEDKEHAQSLGYTVVDPSTVVATHMSKILESNASQLFGFEETQHLLDKLSTTSPKLVKELVPDSLPLGTITSVLQSLLREGVPLTDFRTIVETLTASAIKTKDPEELLSRVRVALGRLITQRIVHDRNDLPIITLKPELEGILSNAVSNSDQGGAGIEPSMAENLQQSLKQLYDQQTQSQQPSVLVVQPLIRSLLARFVRNISSSMHVLSYHEIPDNKQVTIVGTVG